MTITRNSITGYELNCSVVRAQPYLTLVRWNGPLNNFTYLVRNATPCVNGDVLKLTAVGNTFTVYKNGVQVLQGTDATFQKGSPGVGFYNSADTNWSRFGLSNFSASNVGSSDTTPPRIQERSERDRYVYRPSDCAHNSANASMLEFQGTLSGANEAPPNGS
jgi:hypothetical protein